LISLETNNNKTNNGTKTSSNANSIFNRKRLILRSPPPAPSQADVLPKIDVAEFSDSG